MRGILLLNGEPFSEEIDDKNAIVCCADGAYLWANGKVRIDINVGDFDSLAYIPAPKPEKIYPAEKNYTDGEIGILELLKHGATKIEIYGGFGGREDHFLGNLHLLHLAHSKGAECEMVSKNSKIISLQGKLALCGLKGKTISVLPFGAPLHIIHSSGLKYSYPSVINYGECVGISNVLTEDFAELCAKEGEFGLVIINRGSV